MPRLLAGPLVSNLTGAPGYFAETDETGKEKWPRGEEKVWKDGLRAQDHGGYPPVEFHPVINITPVSFY